MATIEILVESSEDCDMARVSIDGKCVMEANEWNFNPSFHGINEYGHFDDCYELADRIQYKFSNEGIDSRIIDGEYTYQTVNYMYMQLPRTNPFKILRNKNGITIAELKALIEDLPETDKNGDPYEVWISNKERSSNMAREIWPLNEGDILIKF